MIQLKDYEIRPEIASISDLSFFDSDYQSVRFRLAPAKLRDSTGAKGES